MRARLVVTPEAWPWSSARAHLSGQDDGLVSGELPTGAVGDWRTFLASGLKARDADDLRRQERTGRPLGSTNFQSELEARLGRRLRPDKRGPFKRTVKLVDWVWRPQNSLSQPRGAVQKSS